MLERGRRVVVAFAVLAVVFGVLVQGSDVGGRLGVERDRQRTSAVMVDAGPVGVVPAATRPRTSFDGELPSVADSMKSRMSGLVLVLSVLVLAVAVLWWRLGGPDRRLVVPLRRSSLPPLRAPPTFV
jgi:hypothetical protein